MFNISVSDEWTELTCSGEAAPEELEGHSMVAHKVPSLSLVIGHKAERPSYDSGGHAEFV